MMDLDINLPVMPLVDSLCSNIQKCLLPSAYEHLVESGTWVKCVVSDKVGFVVCRVFYRDTLKNCCQLANIVGTVADLDGVVLHKLQPLKRRFASPPTSIDVSMDITEEFLHKGKGKLCSDLLKERITHQGLLDNLRALHLMIGCTVRCSNLESNGITAVNLQSCADMTYTDKNLFTIDESTAIRVVDARLVPKISSPFYMHGFERAWSDLNDLMSVANIQASRSLSNNIIRLPLNILVIGAAGCGKTSFVKAFMAEYKCNLFHLTKSAIMSQYHSESIELMSKTFQAAERLHSLKISTSPIVILLDDLDHFCPKIRQNTSNDMSSLIHISAALLKLVDSLYERNLNIICVATTSALENICPTTRRPSRFQRELTIDPPSETDRRLLFQAMFLNSEIKTELKEMLSPKLLEFIAVQTQGYVAADLALLLRNVEKKLLRKQVVDMRSIIQCVFSEIKPTSLRATDVTVFETEHGFESIGGMRTLKQKLEVSVLAGLKHQSVFRRFGLSLPKGVLLYGPPGCGKTKIAKCLAKESNMRFITTSGAEVYSPYVGCAERLISKIFDTARKNAPCLIFLDEIDTLAGRRAIQSNVSSDIQIRILSTLLTEMDGIVGTSSTIDGGKYILVVAATNRPDMIDDALLRPGRFDKLIYVPAPDLESRLSILELLAEHMPLASDVNLPEIAERTSTFSGADMCNLCNEAAMTAFQRDMDTKEISSEDFAKALTHQKSSLCQSHIKMFRQFEKKFGAK